MSDTTEPEQEREQQPAVINLMISAKSDRPATPTQAIAISKLVLEYVKALIWPLVIAVILLVYRPPVVPMLNSLADKLAAASSVKIGSLSLEVEERANDLGVPGLGLKIGQLSPKSIELLLATPREGSMILLKTKDFAGVEQFGVPNILVVTALVDLEKKGLIRPYGKGQPIEKFLAYIKSVGKVVPAEPGSDSQTEYYTVSEGVIENLKHYGYELTPAGNKAVEAITKAVANQLSKP